MLNRKITVNDQCFCHLRLVFLKDKVSCHSGTNFPGDSCYNLWVLVWNMGSYTLQFLLGDSVLQQSFQLCQCLALEWKYSLPWVLLLHFWILCLYVWIDVHILQRMCQVNPSLKPCPQMEYQIKNIFIKKSCRKCTAKASPRPLYNFGK